VRFVGREDWAGMEHGRHAVVIVRTRSGRTYEREVWHEPMSRAELETKFRELVTPKLDAAKTAAVETLLNGLESAHSIRPLVRALRANA